MPDAWRAYLEMALGLTETPRKRAQKAVGELVNRGGATAVQLQGLVEDLLSAGMANREALTNIVRYEVDRALGVVGLATAEEVTELTDRVRDLEKRLRAAQARGVTPEAEVVAEAAPAPRKVAKKAVAKKAVRATPNVMPPVATTVSPVGDTARPAKEPASAQAPAPAKKAVAKKAVKKVAGTVAAPTAPVVEAAAATVIPPVAAVPVASAPAVAFVSPAATGDAPVPPVVAKRAPARKATAKQVPAKPAPVKKAAGATPGRKTAAAPVKSAGAPAKKAAKKAAPSSPEA